MIGLWNKLNDKGSQAVGLDSPVEASNLLKKMKLYDPIEERMRELFQYNNATKKPVSVSAENWELYKEKINKFVDDENFNIIISNAIKDDPYKMLYTILKEVSRLFENREKALDVLLYKNILGQLGELRKIDKTFTIIPSLLGRLLKTIISSQKTDKPINTLVDAAISWHGKCFIGHEALAARGSFCNIPDYKEACEAINQEKIDKKSLVRL